MTGRPQLEINTGLCITEGCANTPRCRGMCQACYSKERYEVKERERRGSKPNRKSIGNTIVNAYGYVLEYVGLDNSPKNRRGYKLQHRLVMEEILGRELESYENVHHKNAIKSDNRPENLELWVRSQPCGARATDLVEYAYWILEKYKDDVSKN